MRIRYTQRAAEERGAILVQVAISILVLMSFMVFVADYGVVWVARGQAQNAADAGALAGAAALAWDDSTYPAPAGGTVDLAARNVAQANLIWHQPGVAVASYPPCPPGVPGSGCIQVNVYQNGEQGSAATLPVLFGSLLNVPAQGMRASATAQVRAANATDCLKPITILDTPAPGYSLEDDYGTPLVLKGDAWPGSGSFRGFVRIDGSGTNELRRWTRTCTTRTFGIGDVLPQEPGNVCAFRDAADDLISLDSGASWDGESVINSCVSTGTCMRFDAAGNRVANPNAVVSPRTVPLAIANRTVWLANEIVQIRGFLGFFVTRSVGPPNCEVHGVLVSRPGVLSPNYGPPDPEGEFTRVIVLVR